MKISLKMGSPDALTAVLESNKAIETLILTCRFPNDCTFNNSLDKLFASTSHLKTVELASLDGQAKVGTLIIIVN